jgi:hypothetical protein
VEAVSTEVIPKSARSGERDQVAQKYGLVTAVQLTRDARITYRQLDYWTRTGLLDSSNPGSGVCRLYPEREVDVARALGAISAAGVAINGPFGRAAVAYIREHGLTGVVTDPEAGILSIDLDRLAATFT